MPAKDDLQRARERLAILLAQEGNHDAFSKLVEWYDQRLLYFIRQILGEADGALDVLQSVWLAVHRKLRSLKSHDAFREWLYRIAHDQAISELRKRIKRPLPVDELEAIAMSDDSRVDGMDFESADLVHRALRDLSVDHRRVLTLHFLEDMTIEQITEVTGCRPGTVKSRLHYAKAALRRRIEELNDE